MNISLNFFFWFKNIIYIKIISIETSYLFINENKEIKESAH